MTSESREGELFVTKTSGLFFQGRSGIVTKFYPRGPATADEEHVTVDWLNGNLDHPKGTHVDSGSGNFRGIPYERTGEVMVKWIKAFNNATPYEPLDEEENLLGVWAH